jgi:hypothetical protein
MMKFHAKVRLGGKTATGIPVPEEVVTALGAGKKPKVRVTIGGYTYRSSIASMGGEFMISLSAENRAGAGVGAGDEIEVDVEVDTEPRELEIPADFATALDADESAKTFLESLSYSQKRRHTLNIEGAKTAETRQRRIEKSVSDLRSGKP